MARAPRRHDWRSFRNPGHRLVLTTVRVSERLKKAADQFLRRFRISLTQFNLLAVLSANPEGIPQSRIGDELTVSRANVTWLVRRGAARGLCRIDPSSLDARLKLVRITREGAALLRRIEGPYFAELRRIARGLSGAQALRAAEALDRLRQGL
jgi:DNA-binding MarR family transcriptional regulator